MMIKLKLTVVAFPTLLLLLHIPHLSALPIFKEYGQPEDSVARIDLDQRSIVARTALASSNGLDQAKQIYKSGGAHAVPITIESLSTGSTIYRDFDLFKKFVDFFGGEQYYADVWIQSALSRTNLQFDSSGGGDKTKNANFMELETEGRSSAVRWGTLVLNVWMAIISHLEKSNTQCETNKDAAHQEWNKAYSYYTGSLAESEHPLGGYLLYSFARVQCEQFGTCQKGTEAPVNKEILQSFVAGRTMILGGDCYDLKQTVKKIENLMAVPLIQATLKTAYAMDLEDDTRQETQGEAAAFSAAVAPIVSTCSIGSANVIYNDLSPGKGPGGSYEVVKAAFERNYDCLGITCAHVGGLTRLNGEYFNRAEACGNVEPVKGATGIAGYDGSTSSYSSFSSSSSSPSSSKGTKTTTASSTGGGLNVGMALGLTISVLVGAAVVTGVVVFSTKPKMKEYDTSIDSRKSTASGLEAQKEVEVA